MFGCPAKKNVIASSLTGLARYAPRLLATCFMGTWIVTPATAETSLTTLRQQTRSLLIEEASRESGSPGQDAAIASLCDLYVILRSDQRYATSNMLQGDAAKIRRRLIGIADQRTHQLQRQGNTRPTDWTVAVDHQIQQSLSQQASDIPSPVEQPIAGAAGGAAIGDNPWALIELIQRIIDPDLWDVRGGTATIQYFAMRRVLVVRATSDTHEKIRELLSALR